jgi:putative peptide zinc metalloprotease protein
VDDDGGRAFDFAFEVLTPRGGDVVDNFNAANAGARCIGCRATAIAFQIVLVSGVPDRLTPHNRAMAVNDSCTRCVVTAEARQSVRVVDRPVKFTDAGRTTLADVRRRLAALDEGGLSVTQIHDAVEAQEARVRAVLADEVVAKADDSEPDVLDRRLLQVSDAG